MQKIESIFGADLKLAGLEKKMGKNLPKIKAAPAVKRLRSSPGEPDFAKILESVRSSKSLAEVRGNYAGKLKKPNGVDGAAFREVVKSGAVRVSAQRRNTAAESAAGIPANRDDLNKMRTVVKSFSGRINAGVTVPGFGGLTLGKDESSLSTYYIETKVVDDVVYGCGYSVHYLFKKVERGINVSNIASVAASAQLNRNKTEVFYSLQTYGMKGTTLVKFFKPTVNKNFDVEGFGVMQSSIDGIHAILSDDSLSRRIKFQPEILKFIQPYELEQI